MSKLSEDEIIKGITKMLNECDKYFDDYGIYLHLSGKKEQYLVQGLLELYNKEKQKNKFINEVKAIGTDDTVGRRYNIEDIILKDYVRKDKIREKIENLENYIQENSDEQGYWGSEHQEDIYAKIEILEELLGE